MFIRRLKMRVNKIKVIKSTNSWYKEGEEYYVHLGVVGYHATALLPLRYISVEDAVHLYTCDIDVNIVYPSVEVYKVLYGIAGSHCTPRISENYYRSLEEFFQKTETDKDYCWARLIPETERLRIND